MAIWWQYFCKVIRVFLPAMERGRHPKQPNQHARAPRLSTSLSSNRISGVVSQRSFTPHLGAGFLLVQWWCGINPWGGLPWCGNGRGTWRSQPTSDTPIKYQPICGVNIYPPYHSIVCWLWIFNLPDSGGCWTQLAGLCVSAGRRDACPTWSWRHEPPTDSVNACRNLDAKVTKNDQKWRKK